MADSQRMAIPSCDDRASAGSSVMANPSWARVKEVLDAALGRPPVERTEFVLGMCGHDRALHSEVQSLLAAMEHAGTFLERRALQSIAPSAGLSAGGTLDFAR